MGDNGREAGDARARFEARFAAAGDVKRRYQDASTITETAALAYTSVVSTHWSVTVVVRCRLLGACMYMHLPLDLDLNLRMRLHLSFQLHLYSNLDLHLHSNLHTSIHLSLHLSLCLL